MWRQQPGARRDEAAGFSDRDQTAVDRGSLLDGLDSE